MELNLEKVKSGTSPANATIGFSFERIHNDNMDEITKAFANTVEKEEGKGLSTNDFTDDAKKQLADTYRKNETFNQTEVKKLIADAATGDVDLSGKVDLEFKDKTLLINNTYDSVKYISAFNILEPKNSFSLTIGRNEKIDKIDVEIDSKGNVNSLKVSSEKYNDWFRIATSGNIDDAVGYLTFIAKLEPHETVTFSFRDLLNDSNIVEPVRKPPLLDLSEIEQYSTPVMPISDFKKVNLHFEHETTISTGGDKMYSRILRIPMKTQIIDIIRSHRVGVNKYVEEIERLYIESSSIKSTLHNDWFFYLDEWIGKDESTGIDKWVWDIHAKTHSDTDYTFYIRTSFGDRLVEENILSDDPLSTDAYNTTIPLNTFWTAGEKFDPTDILQQISNILLKFGNYYTKTEIKSMIDDVLEKIPPEFDDTKLKEAIQSITENLDDVWQNLSNKLNATDFASEISDGVMPKESFIQIIKSRDDIAKLKGMGGRDTLIRAETFSELESMEVPDTVNLGDFSYVLVDETQNKARTKYIWIGTEWEFDGIVEAIPVPLFSKDVAGNIVGSEDTPENDGMIFGEATGQGSVIGWDNIKKRVTNTEQGVGSASNRASIALYNTHLLGNLKPVIDIECPDDSIDITFDENFGLVTEEGKLENPLSHLKVYLSVNPEILSGNGNGNNGGCNTGGGEIYENFARHVSTEVINTAISETWTITQGAATYKSFPISYNKVSTLPYPQSAAATESEATIVDAATGKLQDSRIGQVNQWSITVAFTAIGSQANYGLKLRLRNPDTGEIVEDVEMVSTANNFQNGNITFKLETIGSDSSVGAGKGYVLELGTNNPFAYNSVFNLIKIRRVALAIENVQKIKPTPLAVGRTVKTLFFDIENPITPSGEDQTLVLLGADGNEYVIQWFNGGVLLRLSTPGGGTILKNFYHGKWYTDAVFELPVAMTVKPTTIDLTSGVWASILAI
jgi:hypothetical protein